MQRILALIESTLDAEITPAELAEISGYSLWHFLRLFRSEVGMPLCRYRVRRQLIHAIWHISRGMSITDAALRWGFESHSGFYRAFCKEYGVSPRAWLRVHRPAEPSLPLLKEEDFKMMTRERFREALAHWGEPYAALPLTPVPQHGGVSDSAVYAGEAHVLKAYRDEHACRLAVALAAALAARGIPAATALPLPQGDAALPVVDCFVTLCRRLPGEPLRAETLLLHPEKGADVGAALARLHQATADIGDLPYAEEEPYADHLLHWALPRVQDVLPSNFPPDFAARVEALCDLPTALIHRDPNPSNLIDTEEGVGFTDFDLSRRSLRIFDPCYAMTATLSETFDRDDLPVAENWPTLCRAILAGYERVTPLTDAERAALPTLLLGGEAIALAAFKDSHKYRAVFQTNARMLPWIIAHMPL